ncbi:MAG TPA: AlwI family type II restriction endonuclease [Bacteroidales bacterium]|nr:AlwI family type II restriction endonuclease [Bacteroidales bacterium]HON96964.1 AlwI family type II restriction endonuclease [Bacteroidales bacterium]HOS19713.1 AlwI family type II restriction endonuclease [Bacteroidales bacterium]HOU81570.1 AlwI family type II restriction endonuclease [Bacteroidales bacterium]HQE77530.1 AlwI family type II restriction endonuclease [Bacteroidales bacterium]
MTKPWSISTTIRNPERLRDFLMVLKTLEGQEFDKKNQIVYQILLIKEKIYKPTNIPDKYLDYYNNPESKLSFEIANEIFDLQKYKDPPMRGRQSVNPLNKLGFSIARQGYGKIKITELGNIFLQENYDLSYIFFKSLLKLQFPNPWSADFSEKDGFNIMPFIAIIKLLKKINERSENNGLTRHEFCIFIPTLKNYDQIDEYVDNILNYRKSKNKKIFIENFVKKFYQIDNIEDKKINNLYDYGDNIMRYFRLTKYFKLSISNPLGTNWTIDIEKSRIEEINQLLLMYDGSAIKFSNTEDYLNYIADISLPKLPWENIENLNKIFISLKNETQDLINNNNIQILLEEEQLLNIDTKNINVKLLEDAISQIRNLNLKIKEKIRKNDLLNNISYIEKLIQILQDDKNLRKYSPEQFEKLITESFKIINDEILIKPNYPVDDDGEPINHSPKDKADIECYYKNFRAICEVTLNTSKLQWVLEGQPIMRHLRDFENKNKNYIVFCIFIAPKVNVDTYSQFWLSVKYEYDGKPQKIVPMTTYQFSFLLKALIELLKYNKRFTHIELYNIYNSIINKTNEINGFSKWAEQIEIILNDWFENIIKIHEIK